MDVTSLDRKPAIPPDPAEGASLNLLAERWSKVRGGVLMMEGDRDIEREEGGVKYMTAENWVCFTALRKRVPVLPCRLVVSRRVQTLDDGKAVGRDLGSVVAC